MKLADLVSHVIGVDSHRDTNTVAVVDAVTAGVCACETASTSCDGYETLVELADQLCEASERVWAIEGTGSYGSGLAALLTSRGEWVIEIDRPSRPARRNGAKDDELDAVRAAREALGKDRWAEPRARGEREAMRVLVTTREGAVRDRTRAINQLKAVVVSAPDQLRDKLRDASTTSLVARCARLRRPNNGDVELDATVDALRRLARRIRHLDAEIDAHDRDLQALTATHCPHVLAERGVGAITAAMVYIAWSHPGRCRDEAAFANLAGVAPIPASSGQTIRYRLNRGGDRQLNRALHAIVMTRARCDDTTKAYIARRVNQDNKTAREARRCLKRYTARHLYRLLEAGAPTLDAT